MDFAKVHNTQNCLLVMVEKMKLCIDTQCTAAALLTDLSKAFECINHKLLIAKLNSYRFHYNSLKLLYDYLLRRKQRVKINNTLSEWTNIESGVPQGSILGPMLSNIFINDIFYFMEDTDITNYANDNTPYTTHTDINIAIKTLDSNGNKILGPMLFNIFINDIFYFMEDTDITNYADDNTPYTTHTDLNIAIKTLILGFVRFYGCFIVEH